MLKIAKRNDQRIDLELQGQIGQDQMRAGLDDLLEASAEIKHGKMLYRITDFKVPTFGAIMIEFARLPKLFGLIRKFGRVAVLADGEWVRKISEMEGKLYPDLEIRAFEPDQEAEAEAWLEGGIVDSDAVGESPQ